MTREVESIAVKQPDLQTSLQKAFYMYVIHFCGTEQNFLRIFEMSQDGRVEINVRGTPANMTKIKYVSPSLFSFLDIFIRKFVDYPPVKSREIVSSWVVLMDSVHFSLIESFRSLFEETIRLSIDEREFVLHPQQVMGIKSRQTVKNVFDTIASIKRDTDRYDEWKHE